MMGKQELPETVYSPKTAYATSREDRAMTLSSEQFHTLYDGAAQPVVLVQDGAVAECNCHAQEFFTAGTALCAYLPQDTALPETLPKNAAPPHAAVPRPPRMMVTAKKIASGFHFLPMPRSM